MERVKKIAEEIKDRGGRAFIVGGFVRDKFMDGNIVSKDIDLEVFGIEPDELKSIVGKFGKVNECGKSFGVLKLDDLDISLPRRERKTGVGHKGFETECDPHMSIEDACRRRDLSINAILFDPLTDELIDPFNGINDIDNKVLRHIDDIRFAEDPLRVLRVAQFHARFDFRVHDETNELCRVLIDELKHLSFERFFIETEKILMKADKPSKAFKWMLEMGILDEIFPEIAVLDTIEQGKKYHPEGSVFVHTMLALDSVPKEDRTIELMLSVLCHDTGKACIEAIVREDEPEDISFKGHNKAGVEPTKTFLNRITRDKELIETVVTQVIEHMVVYDIMEQPRKKVVRRLALRCDVPLLMKVHRADRSGRLDTPNLDYIETILEIFEEIKNEIHPLIQGRHLMEFGLTPSPEFGIILSKIFEAQLDGEFSTLEDGLEFTKTFIWRRDDKPSLPFLENNLWKL